MIIVCLTCNITLPRRRGSHPDGARSTCFLAIKESLPCGCVQFRGGGGRAPDPPLRPFLLQVKGLATPD